MKGGKAYRCQCIRTTRGMSKPAHIKPRCSTPAIRSSSGRLIVMKLVLGGADDREHRQDDVVNERRRKQPERRARGDERGEQPAAPAVSESQPPAQSRALAGDARTLNQEISG